MVVHRGHSWDASTDTSLSSTLQSINHNTLAETESDLGIFKSNLENQPELLVEMKNPFNMRQVILNNLSSAHKPNSHSHHRHSHVPFNRLRGRSVTSAAKSLDILRQNLQSAINKEIDAVIKKYLEKFFRPAIDNVRTNLGVNSVSEEHVRDVCRAMLDEAKQMYVGPISRGSSPFSDSDTSALIEGRMRRRTDKSQSPSAGKRKESDTDSETCQVVLKKRVPQLPSNHGKKDPSQITKSTNFILGSKANKILGLGHVLGKGRLYVKHPQLFKYCCDQQDQEWLASHRHTLVSLASTKVYIMLLDEIKELAHSDEYRNNPNLLTHELKGFEVPDFMLKKIKISMRGEKSQSPESPAVTSPEVQSPGAQNNLSLESICSTLTPPAIEMFDSGPSPSEALELLEPSFLSLVDDQTRVDCLADLLFSPPDHLLD